MSNPVAQGTKIEFVDAEEEYLLHQFRQFKFHTPFGTQLRVVCLTTEEENVLLEFRQFKNKIVRPEVFQRGVCPHVTPDTNPASMDAKPVTELPS